MEFSTSKHLWAIYHFKKASIIFYKGIGFEQHIKDIPSSDDMFKPFQMVN